jgi:hypothetical protein
MKRSAIAAELSQLRKMLSDIEKTSPLARLGIESRISDLEKQCDSIPVDGIQRARVELTFRGAPVQGTQGVEAQFAGNALEKYDKAIALAAASMSQEVRLDGRIPGREFNKLFVTDRALGSFGFILEEISVRKTESGIEPELIFDEKSLTSKAVEQTKAIIFACANEDDEKLVEVASQVDRRTISAIRDFLETVGKSNAYFKMRCDDQVTEFKNVESVQTAAERLADDNIIEADIKATGYLFFLPAKRTFEITPEDGNEVFYGKIDPDMSEDKFKEMGILLGKKAIFTLHVTKVGRVRLATRYRLLDWEKSSS